ncbi:hypothetical protein ACIRD3_00375 [Kitasatospora sp. NPDC093550]|uniref:hypothetical protein n=1 Tax=Kitasatospora sp. NPDC093550 TaxID=3364089 RepID=UPI00381C7699
MKNSPLPVKNPPFYGYHENASGSVILTYRCRKIGVLRSADQIRTFRWELAASTDRQLVIAHWARLPGSQTPG